MRILQIAPLWETVPPPAYGGTEAVVSVLTDGLVRAGHEVTLAASGDSTTLAKLLSVYPHSLRTASEISNGSPYDWIHAACAVGSAGEFDIIHNHAGELVMALSVLAAAPMLSTMHCLTTPDTEFVWRHYDGYFNTISQSQNKQVPQTDGTHVGTVYNAIDVATFPFRQEKDDYILCLNRISPEKGTHIAIEAAKRSGQRLILAGKVDKADRAYYREVVEPLIDGQAVTYVGEANQRQKRDLFSGAKGLLMPICWEEPFGLVPVEAMACGTAVIAFSRGAMPELIIHEETGFLVDNVDAMVAAIAQLDCISPERCRQHVVDRFDVDRLVSDYCSVYERILEEEALGEIQVMFGTGAERGDEGAAFAALT